MNQRNLKIDLLRIIAAGMVILIHVAAQYWDAYPVYTYRWMSVNFYDSLARAAVPLFLMISGMFLLAPEKPLTLTMLWKKYIKKILIIFFGWSIFYAGFYDILLCVWRHGTIQWSDFLLHVCRGHYHLWYCIMLLGIYLILPFLKKIAAEETLLRYFLLLLGTFCIVVPWITSPYVKAFREFLYFSFGSIFVWYFMMGFYLHRYPLSNGKRRIIYVLALLGFAATFLGSQWKALTLGIPYGYYDPQMPGVVCMAIGIFTFFEHRTERTFEKTKKWIQAGAAYSLGIYLLHPFVLMLLDHSGMISPMWHLAFAIPLKAGIVFVFSWLGASLLKHIPILGKYLL